MWYERRRETLESLRTEPVAGGKEGIFWPTWQRKKGSAAQGAMWRLLQADRLVVGLWVGVGRKAPNRGRTTGPVWAPAFFFPFCFYFVNISSLHIFYGTITALLLHSNLSFFFLVSMLQPITSYYATNGVDATEALTVALTSFFEVDAIPFEVTFNLNALN